jgi:AraC-like DNA-binding protein
MQSSLSFISRQASPGFAYAQARPVGASRRLVSYYWEIQAARCRTAVESALPDISVEISFNLGPNGRHLVNEAEATAPSRTSRSGWVTGPRANTLLIAKEILDSRIVGVRLRSTTVQQVLGVTAQALEGTMVDLDLLLGPRAERIRNRLAEASTTAARIDILEDEVIHPALSRQHGSEPEPVRALCQALWSGAEASVGHLAESFGFTHRKVIALFDEHVGLKPKTWHRIARLRRVMEAAVRGRQSWARLAVQSGYFDQAHMIHEFRRLTGLTPAEYLARRTSVGDGFVPFRFAHMRCQ